MVSTDESRSTDVAGAGPVRDEDAFDVKAVAAWLSDHAGIDVTPVVRQFPGGASNLTYLLSYDDRDLVLRRPPAGAKAKTAHDMGREYRIQSGLKPVFGLVPAMVGFCEDGYWVESSDDEFAQKFRRQPTTSPGMWRRAEVLAHYADRTGRSVAPDQWRFYEVFGLFRLAVIAQQIYYRYFHGQTHNEAYAEFGDGARYFEGRCLALIDA